MAKPNKRKRKPLTPHDRESILGKIGMKGFQSSLPGVSAGHEALARMSLHRIMDSMSPELQRDMIREVAGVIHLSLAHDRGQRKTMPIQAVDWLDFQAAEYTDEQIAKLAAVGDTVPEEIWRNNLYEVQVRNTGPFNGDGPDLWHLSIKRINKEPIHDWRHLQRIKNEMLGPNCEAVELYPTKSRLVDGANQYHLWGFRDPEARFPVGWEAVEEVDPELAKKLAPNAVQRTMGETFND